MEAIEISFFVAMAEQFGIVTYVFYFLCGIGLTVVAASIIAPFTKTKIDDNIVTVFSKYSKLFGNAFFAFALKARKEKT